MISLTSPVRTRAHDWPAGAKLLALAGTTVGLFVTGSVWGQLGWLLAALVLYALPGWRFLRHGLRRLWGLWPFVLVLLAWHLFTGDFAGGAVIVLRMSTAVALANLVTMTTRLEDMQALVLWLLRPLRRVGVRGGAIALAMAMVVRFIPVLTGKGRKLAEAWRARSPRRAGWRIVMPLVVLAVDDAEHVADALRARGGIRDLD